MCCNHEQDSRVGCFVRRQDLSFPALNCSCAYVRVRPDLFDSQQRSWAKPYKATEEDLTAIATSTKAPIPCLEARNKGVPVPKQFASLSIRVEVSCFRMETQPGNLNSYSTVLTCPEN